MEQFNKKQIIELLNSKIQIWRFPRLLKELDGDADTLQVRLTKKLSSYELQGSENREQTARKIRNWLAGKNQPANREELFRICFALGFDREKTETLFLSADENSIHYRNPRELIYAFCLEKGYPYPLALELVQELGEENMTGSRLENQTKIRKTSDTDSTQTMTASIRDEFKRLDTLDDLKQFIQKNRETFGYHHNTAYRKFKVMLSYLLTGKSDHESYSNTPREKRYSIERATEEYLRMGLPYQKKSGHYSKVEKIIKRHWPSPKMVQEMYSRKRDVNRKTLLLLYLATEGMGVSEPSETSFVQEHCQRIDLMLTSCGMPLLNPHNPFDYLVMQSLHLENDDDFMSWKMERILKKLFREPYQPSYVAVGENEDENGR